MPAIHDVNFRAGHIPPWDSGSEGSNDDSYLPQITSKRGCRSSIQACYFG
jgi:hypothetical protein